MQTRRRLGVAVWWCLDLPSDFDFWVGLGLVVLAVSRDQIWYDLTMNTIQGSSQVTPCDLQCNFFTNSPETESAQ